MQKLFRIFLSLGILFSFGNVEAQMGAVEVRAAYQLAVESLNNKQYKTALEYIDLIKQNSKSVNSGILYLQIKILREMNATRDGADAEILLLISEFEKAPDYTNFNEDKVLEITKLKLSLRNKKNAFETNFDNAVRKYGPLNISIEELTVLKPELKLNEWKTFQLSETKVLYHSPALQYDIATYPFPSTVKGGTYYTAFTGVIVTNGKITGYQSILRNVEDKKTDERTLLGNFYEYVTNLTQSYKNAFNFQPQNEKLAIDKRTAFRTFWKKDNRCIQLDEMDYIKNNTVFIKLIETISID